MENKIILNSKEIQLPKYFEYHEYETAFSLFEQLLTQYENQIQFVVSNHEYTSGYWIEKVNNIAQSEQLSIFDQAYKTKSEFIKIKEKILNEISEIKNKSNHIQMENNKSMIPDRIKKINISNIGSLKEIFEHIKDLPDNQRIISQVVDNTGKAWFMGSDFIINVNSSRSIEGLSLITLSHPELHNLPVTECVWKRVDNGMMGFHDYEYKTSCGITYDCDKVEKDNYCPNCGGKIQK